MMEENYAISMNEENFGVISHSHYELSGKNFFFRKNIPLRHLEYHFFVLIM